jgi:hypothetical protein
MASYGMIYIPSFMKTGTGVQIILRFCLRNFTGCDVSITDVSDFCNGAIEMGSGAVTYVPSFIKISSGIQKLIGGIQRHTHTNRQQGDLISLLLFFQNKESELIMLQGW